MEVTDIDITKTFDEWIPALRKEFIKDNKISSKRIVYTSVQKKFPDFINLLESLRLKDWFREVMYCILSDVQYIPKCPVCGSPVPLRNFIVGFQKTCSSQCSIKFLHNDETAKKIAETQRMKHMKSCSDNSIYKRYDIRRDSTDKNYFIVHNYCEHGDVRIYDKTLCNIEQIGQSTFCVECNKNMFDLYVPTEQEIADFQKDFSTFYFKHRYALNSKWWILYYPKQLKILKVYYEKYFGKFDENDAKALAESYYVFLHKLTSVPKCAVEGCNEHTKFQGSTNTYTTFCEFHGISYNCSGKEYELKHFIDSLNIPYVHDDRELINKELDFYFAANNFAIEFNGCWYHSDYYKDKSYHKDKYNRCKNKGVQLMTVWEDDWTHKQDIVKSIIKSKLGIYDNRLGARQTIIKEVDTAESRTFLDENHLQGYCNSRYRYGLYYNGELIQLMTFGISRFNKNEIELLRLCTKLGYCVVGGASKLFTHFIKKHSEIQEIISYADCDISNGNIYDMLGFKYEHTTDNWTWLYKGERINRINKIRNQQHELGLHKCYGSGTMKYRWTKN